MNAERRLVVDANIVVKWFVEEPYWREARQLIQPGRVFLAPDLILLEVENALLKKVRRLEIDAASADAARIAVPAYLQQSASLPLSDTAFSLALRYQLTIYDAVYVVLALQERCQLITADQRLVNALGPAYYGDTLVWLGDSRLP